MSVKLLPYQIPKLWNEIKFAFSTVNGISDGRVLNKLLLNLLNDKAQCFVRTDDNLQLMALMTSEIIIDGIDEKCFVVTCLYSFKSTNQNQWSEDIEFIKRFAKAVGCKKITFQTNNPRISELGLSNGFKEDYRSYSIEV
jgi:hypothetical protein